jgi:hypothetical protein
MVSKKVEAVTSGTKTAHNETMRITVRALQEKTPHASTVVVAAALKPALRNVKPNAKAPAQEALTSRYISNLPSAEAKEHCEIPTRLSTPRKERKR